jgi:HlyD family secretion protein
MAGDRTLGISTRGVGKTVLGVLAVATVALLVTGRSARPIAAPAQTDGSAGQGPSPASSAASPTSVVALARLRPAAGVIAVGIRPGVRVEEVKVKEGDPVAAGAGLAILEGRAAAQHQLDLANAQKARADRQRSPRLATAQKAAETSKRRRDEATKLYKQFGGTLQGKERYDAELALFQVEMQALKADLDLQLLEGDRGSEDAILRAQVQLAEDGLRATEVRAAGSGQVLRILVHPGELSNGTLLEMADLSSMVATAEVYQSDVPRLRVGDPAVVNILGNPVAGTVARIGSIVGKNQLTSVDPRALRDLRVVEVTVQLVDSTVAARYVNMEVEVTIRPSGTEPAHDANAAGPGSR